MEPNTTLSVCILSGKGGVGKTNLSLNLGYCLSRGDHSTLLMDCDMGLANLDVMVGLTPDKNLQDLIDLNLDPSEVIIPVEPEGKFDILPAASGVPELVEMDEQLRFRLFKKLDPFFRRYDFLFLDLGAGINPVVVSLAVMSKIRIVIVTPEPTSLTDSYALIKVLSTQYEVSKFHILINMVEDKKEEQQTYERLKAACQRFLNVELKYLGSVRSDPMVSEAIQRQTPLVKIAPNSPASQDIINLSAQLKSIRDEMLPSLAGDTIFNRFPSKFDLETLDGK